MVTFFLMKVEKLLHVRIMVKILMRINFVLRIATGRRKQKTNNYSMDKQKKSFFSAQLNVIKCKQRGLQNLVLSALAQATALP